MDAIASKQTRTNYFLQRMKALNLQFDLIILSLSKVSQTLHFLLTMTTDPRLVADTTSTIYTDDVRIPLPRPTKQNMNIINLSDCHFSIKISNSLTIPSRLEEPLRAPLDPPPTPILEKTLVSRNDL